MTVDHAVYGLFVVECIQVGISTHDAYEIFGVGWGNLAALLDPQMLWLTPVLSGASESSLATSSTLCPPDASIAVSSAVQCFFAWRIFVLSKNMFLGIFIALVRLVSGHTQARAD